MDNEILDYKDLAAIPKVKAIYDIERPDLITYEPFYSSGYDDKQERQSLGEVINSQTEVSEGGVRCGGLDQGESHGGGVLRLVHTRV